MRSWSVSSFFPNVMVRVTVPGVPLSGATSPQATVAGVLYVPMVMGSPCGFNVILFASVRLSKAPLFICIVPVKKGVLLEDADISMLFTQSYSVLGVRSLSHCKVNITFAKAWCR